MTHAKAELVRRNYEEYKERVDPNEAPATVIADMIADLLHLSVVEQTAEHKEVGEFLDIEEIIARAVGHFMEESIEEDDADGDVAYIIELLHPNPWEQAREKEEP